MSLSILYAFSAAALLVVPAVILYIALRVVVLSRLRRLSVAQPVRDFAATQRFSFVRLLWTRSYIRSGDRITVLLSNVCRILLFGVYILIAFAVVLVALRWTVL